jgi:hypothetical protein
MSVGRIVTMALFAALLAGCERGPRQEPAPTAPPPPVAEAPATQPIVQIPATMDTTEPFEATLAINQQEYSFPAAILRLEQSGRHVNARLITDDPPTAIEEDYHGDSFDLVMKLNISEPGQIDGADWKYSDRGVERQDESAHGLFLDGQRHRLHPQDVEARFQQQGEKVMVRLSGWFLLYESSGSERSAPPRRVYVQGNLAATVVKQ